MKYINKFRFIKYWSYNSAKFLQLVMEESHIKRNEYYYGFQFIYGALFKGLVFLSLGLLLNILTPMLLTLVSFASLRIFTGGYHMKSYGKCVIFSFSLFVLSAIFVKFMSFYNIWHGIVTLIIFIITFIVIRFYSPVANENSTMSDSKYRKFKIISQIITAIGFTLAIININTMLTISINIGMLLILSVVSPIGIKMYEKIEYKVEL